MPAMVMPVMASSAEIVYLEPDLLHHPSGSVSPKADFRDGSGRLSRTRHPQAPDPPWRTRPVPKDEPNQPRRWGRDVPPTRRRSRAASGKAGGVASDTSRRASVAGRDPSRGVQPVLSPPVERAHPDRLATAEPLPYASSMPLARAPSAKADGLKRHGRSGGLSRSRFFRSGRSRHA